MAATAVQDPVADTPHHAEELEVDGDYDNDEDSAYGGSNGSETTSVNSSIYKGYVEHGRRYQVQREGFGQYRVPADERQFESMGHGHQVYYILNSLVNPENPLFCSPIQNPQNILDLGTGQGDWAIEVADAFPSATVYGIDLYPPPLTYVSPNCILQVDDMLKDWTFNKKWDLIHMRQLLGSFGFEGFENVYKQAYENLVPGGWLEHLDSWTRVHCNDGSMPKDCALAQYADIIDPCAERCGNRLDICDDMVQRFKDAGFVNVKIKDYKIPIGKWPKNRTFKDAGAIHLDHWKEGVEGWALWLLTKFGAPKPWTVDEVQAYLTLVRKDLENPRYHGYTISRRVWGQKPLNAEDKKEAAAQ